MIELTDKKIHTIQEEFRKFPHYPTIEDLSYKYRITLNDVIDVVNLNPKIGAFIYNKSVYTSRHIRQFQYLVDVGTPQYDIWKIFGIGSNKGWSLFQKKAQELLSEDKTGPVKQEPVAKSQSVSDDIEKERTESKPTESERKEEQTEETVLIKKEPQSTQIKNTNTKQECKKMLSPEEIKARDKIILDYYKKGYTQNKIAEELGITRSSVERAIHRMVKDGTIIPAEKKKEEPTAETPVSTLKRIGKIITPFAPKELNKEKTDAPDNEREVEQIDVESPKRIITRSEKIDKLADELVKKLRVSKSSAGRALYAARDAVEYAFKFGEVKNYTIAGGDDEVTITLCGDGYTFALSKKL